MTATEVRHYFGDISDMTLFRWLRDERLAFPKPIVVNRRRLFSEAAIHDFAARRQVEQAA